MTTLHSFIISWEGQHQRAGTIADSIESQSDHTTIVYSDPDPLFSFDASRDALRRPNDLMFGDKFHACLDHCRSDVLLLIHADCECETWPELVQSCRNAFDGLSDVNLWAPSIGYTRYSVGVTELSRLPHSNLSIVAATDAIIVGFRSSTIDRLKRCDLNKTLHGWGIDWVLACHTYAHNMIAVVDRAVQVRHKKSHSYPHDAARAEMNDLLDGLTRAEKVLYRLLMDHIGSQIEERRKHKRRFKFW